MENATLFSHEKTCILAPDEWQFVSCRRCQGKIFQPSTIYQFYWWRKPEYPLPRGNNWPVASHWQTLSQKVIWLHLAIKIQTICLIEFNDSIIIFTNFKTFYLPSYTFSWEKNKFFHSILYTVDINYALIYSQTLDWCRMNQQYYFKLVHYSLYYIDAHEIPRIPSEKNTIISSSEFTVWCHSTNAVTIENAIELSTMKNKSLFGNVLLAQTKV